MVLRWWQSPPFFYIDKAGTFDTSLLLWYNYLYGKIVRRDIYRKEFVWYSKKKNIFGWRQ